MYESSAIINDGSDKFERLDEQEILELLDIERKRLADRIAGFNLHSPEGFSWEKFNEIAKSAESSETTRVPELNSWQESYKQKIEIALHNISELESKLE
jgi:hypothetical protein